MPFIVERFKFSFFYKITHVTIYYEYEIYQTSQKIILDDSFILSLKRALESHCLYHQETRYTTPGQCKRRLYVLP